MATSTNQSTPEAPIVRTATQAREGVTGHGVRYVLVISTAAIVVIFGALWLFYFHYVAPTSSDPMVTRLFMSPAIRAKWLAQEAGGHI